MWKALFHSGSRAKTVRAEFEIGDVFVKEVANTPRERWPRWTITRLLQNADGAPHAILTRLDEEKTTRRVSLVALRRSLQWQLYEKASGAKRQ